MARRSVEECSASILSHAGADNALAEFNHTQLVPEKRAPLDLRETITPAAPKDLREMWLASGIDEHVDDGERAEAALAWRRDEPG